MRADLVRVCRCAADALQQEKIAEVLELETSLLAATNKTLDRRLGIALLNYQRKHTSQGGSKEKAPDVLGDLVRLWDTNKDGQIQNIELRQAVRNSMALSADNASIDALFASMDLDGNGKLDHKEMKAGLAHLLQQAKEAEEEVERIQARVVEVRKLGALLDKAASAIDEIGARERELQSVIEGREEGAGHNGPT
jgi:hypothetical protein